ncbi:protein neprosin-like [Silene latifolia]|uniref:protein neprosin-like n=1 Tax=Silene latifolia TaxID=37657 RepID=UPI003D788FC1
MRKEMFFKEWRIIVGFLVLTFSINFDVTQAKGVSVNLNNKLKAMIKPAVKSIKSSDGDVIDCVNIYNQPAFDHPALKNHTIQMRPSFIVEKDAIKDKNISSGIETLEQTWQKSGGCPDGTVPIRRVTKKDLLRFHNLERFGMKAPSFIPNTSYPDRTLIINNVNVSVGPQPNFSSAELVAVVIHYLGIKGTMSIWNPRVERWDEYTTAQLWLQSGSTTDLESVQAGWIVNKKLYGDTRTRFFTYWTRDGSQKTGCFDLICSGFVQTTTKVALGAAFASISSPGGAQCVFTAQITRDSNTGNWWLVLGDSLPVGYWPASLFTHVLGQGATMLQWGGEVYSTNVRKIPHTTTAMGSGEFLNTNRGYSCFIDHLRVLIEPKGEWQYPNPHYVGTYVDEKNCYGASLDVPGFMTEPTLFFGGPGRSNFCP